MYEMDERAILSTTKYVASMKKKFLVSEICTYLDDNPGIEEVYSVIKPHLAELNLLVSVKANDYELFLKEPASPFIHDDDTISRQKSFLQFPALPEDFESRINDFIVKKTGKPLNDPLTLERIRNAVREQKAGYWRGGSSRNIKYRKGYSVMAYLAYQAPVYIVQFEHLLSMLMSDGLLMRNMRILDAGTGPGVVPLAIIDFYRRFPGNSAEIFAIEQSDEFIEAYNNIVIPYNDLVPGVRIHQPLQGDIGATEVSSLPSGLDLVVLQNVLNEISDISARVEIISTYAGLLNENGLVLIVEPADLDNSTGLRKTVSAALDKGISIYAPCAFIWGSRCRPESCWSFEEKPSIRPPSLMQVLAACSESYRYLNTDIKYSYAILKKNRVSRMTYRVPRDSRMARFSSLHQHLNRRINCAALKMSGNLGDEKTFVYKVCDGTTGKPVFAVLPSYHIADGNRSLIDAAYGSVLQFTAVDVRRNPAHGAYNLLVTQRSGVCEVK
jgi:hypothetical protein